MSLGEYSTVGSLMGFVRGKNMLIAGLFARMMYRSLYKMHEQALHGTAKTALDTLAREETVLSVDRRCDDFDRRWSAFEDRVSAGSLRRGDDPEIAALNARLEQINDAVNNLPESLSLQSLEEKVRMLAGAAIGTGDDDPAVADWSRVAAGPWLAKTLQALRAPDGDGADPGPALKGTLRP